MPVRRQDRPLIVPIFIPNQGCPYQCVFCQQEIITGQSNRSTDRSRIKKSLDNAIESSKYQISKEREVAFYGGTFTRLPTPRIIGLLKTVKPYLDRKLFTSIRVSTRPDMIEEDLLDLLKSFGVTTVELGVQSMDDEVLRLSRRGHTARHTVDSVYKLRKHGFKVGIQLMPGLPGDSEARFMRTINEVIGLKPDMARLYPAIVIKGTKLAEWYLEKRYEPLSLKEAIKICQESCIRLEKRGIPVIRIGVMSSPSLLREGQILAGPWHRSFGFLVRSGIHQKAVEPYLPRPGKTSRIGLRIPPREIPLVRGYKNRGIESIEKKTGTKVVYVRPDYTVSSGQIGIDTFH